MNLDKMRRAIVDGIEHELRHGITTEDWDGEVDDMCERAAELIAREAREADWALYFNKDRFPRRDELLPKIYAAAERLGLM